MLRRVSLQCTSLRPLSPCYISYSKLKLLELKARCLMLNAYHEVPFVVTYVGQFPKVLCGFAVYFNFDCNRETGRVDRPVCHVVK